MNKRAYGFTIVELLIVIVIIAILAAVTVVAYTGIQNRARITSLQSNLSQMAKKLEAQRVIDDGAYPSTLTGASLSSPSDGDYMYSGSSTGYCLSGSIGNTSYRVSSTNKTPTEGSCSGVLADGSSCPTGFIVVPGNSTFGTSNFCVMKYEAKNSGGVATSQAVGTPWVNILQTTATTASQAACSGCHLITEAEWMTIAANVLSVSSNWSGGAVGSGYIYSGHNDSSPNNALAATSNDNDGYYGTGNTTPSNQRRTLTLTNGEVIWDFAGNVREWTSEIITGAQPSLDSGGFAWREYAAITNWGNLLANSRPSAIAGVGSYTSVQGIGQIYSYGNASDARTFDRGGSWDVGGSAGVLSLALSYTQGSTSTTRGFRVAK